MNMASAFKEPIRHHSGIGITKIEVNSANGEDQWQKHYPSLKMDDEQLRTNEENDNTNLKSVDRSLVKNGLECTEDSSSILSSNLRGSSHAPDAIHCSNLENSSSHSIGEEQSNQIRSYTTLLIFYCASTEFWHKNQGVTNILSVIKAFGIIILCFLSTLPTSTGGDFMTQEKIIKSKGYQTSGQILLGKPTKAFLSRKTFLLFLYTISWLYLWNIIEESIQNGITIPVHQNDEERCDLVSNSTIIAQGNETDDTIGFLNKTYTNLTLPHSAKRTSLCRCVQKQDFGFSRLHLLSAKRCTPRINVLKRKTQEKNLRRSLPQNISYYSLKEYILLKDNLCVQKSIPVDKHSGLKISLLMELLLHSPKLHLSTLKRNNGTNLSSNHKKREKKFGVIEIIKKSLELIFSVHVRKQHKSLHLIKVIGKSMACIKNNSLQFFKRNDSGQTQEMLSTLFIVWTSPGVN